MNTFPKINPTKTKAWSNLMKIREGYTHLFPLKEQSQKNEGDDQQFKFKLDELTYDFSKNYLSEKIFNELTSLADQCQLENAIGALKNGTRINQTEDRAVLHTALRSENNYTIDQTDIKGKVKTQLERVETFCNRFHAKEIVGVTNEHIDTIVNIGIGGSDLGPAFVNEALVDFNKGIKTFYLNNIDGDCLTDILQEINPTKTLFIVVSKTFSTTETMTNAASIKNWYLTNGYNEKEVLSKHFIAVTTEESICKANEFGINDDQIFLFWNWVSGRFSLWSAAGISIPLAIGYENFKLLLKGAEKADTHFFNTAFQKNIPVIDGLLTVWYSSFWKYTAQAVLPYSHRLKKLVPYLQQTIMESNGKSMDRNNETINYQTCPIIFGGEGTNSQHSFFQLLHQGTQIVPSQFISISSSKNKYDKHLDILNANCLSQTEALLSGQDHPNPQKYYEGNRPSTLITLESLSPLNLGSLLALYEHKIFVEGVVWNIFSFDQWGVELGKKLAKDKLEMMNENLNVK